MERVLWQARKAWAISSNLVRMANQWLRLVNTFDLLIKQERIAGGIRILQFLQAKESILTGCRTAVKPRLVSTRRAVSSCSIPVVTTGSRVIDSLKPSGEA